MIEFVFRLKWVLILLLLLLSSTLYAQNPTLPGGGRPAPCPPGSQNPNCNNPDPNPVPITGIEILLGAGALLGAKKFVDGRRKKEGE